MQLIKGLRKGTILRHPTLTCLSEFHTVNLLSGCPFECRYCYTQSFANHPGWGKVVFYENTYELLCEQLGRMRRRPRMVFFSTSCEPFAPFEPVLSQLFLIMRLLLENGVSVFISSKACVPLNFVELFSRYAQRVFVQVGLTTTDDSLRQVIEPYAATVDERLTTLDALRRHGVGCEIRCDPVIPGVTDDDENVRAIFLAARDFGLKSVMISYLFLRSATERAVAELLGDARKLFCQRVEHYCGDGVIRVIDASYRKAKYTEFSRLAEAAGVSLRFCRCKNPDLTDQCCNPVWLADEKMLF